MDKLICLSCTTFSGIFHEICQIKTEKTSAEPHVECTRTRQQYDNQELYILLTKLKQEEIFFANTNQLLKLLSERIMHDEIFENICTPFVRGQTTRDATGTCNGQVRFGLGFLEGEGETDFFRPASLEILSIFS